MIFKLIKFVFTFGLAIVLGAIGWSWLWAPQNFSDNERIEVAGILMKSMMKDGPIDLAKFNRRVSAIGIDCYLVNTKYPDEYVVLQCAFRVDLANIFKNSTIFEITVLKDNSVSAKKVNAR